MENIEFKESFNIKCEEKDCGKRLDIFLQEVISDSTRNYIQKLIENENIIIKGKNKLKAGFKLKGNEEIIINIPENEEINLEPEDIKIDIIYEDKDMVVINKESNMVVHPAHGNYNGTLVNAILYHIKDLSGINGMIRPGIVHRLDKDTSGIIVVAKNDIAHLNLSEMFKNKTLEKIYICICKGNFKERLGRIENIIGRDLKDRKKMAVVEENGKKAVSIFEVIEEVRDYSLVKVKIETGRTHQIRVHMKSLNHPIYGDQIYGSSNSKDLAKRQMLHAYNLQLNHPINGKVMNIFAKIPEDMENIGKKLGFNMDIFSKNNVEFGDKK